jgi:peptide methionine sulfoxide reductase msrA/msrB
MNPPSNDKAESDSSTQLAIFAGGCFWCMEPVFRIQKGVKDAVVGYSGGTIKNPTYDQVSTGKTGHREAIQITFDPTVTPYEKLLDIYWHNIDPTDEGGQFADRGDQYQTAIYFHDEDQREKAEESRETLEKSGRFRPPIATQILRYRNFYPAEEVHQRYSQKNPLRYALYHEGSGRDEFLAGTWNRLGA